MEVRRPASRWALVHRAALAWLLAGCIGPNPDFMEPSAATASGTVELATSDATTSDATTSGTTSGTDGITSASSTTADGTATVMGAGDTTTSMTTGATGGGEATGDTDTPGETTHTEPWGCSDPPMTLGGGRLDLVFVVDRSAVMMHPWDHDGDDLDADGVVDGDPKMAAATAPVARWASVHQAIEEVSQRFDASVRMGLALYPSEDATKDYSPQACLVSDAIEVGLAKGNAAALVAAMPPPGAALVGASPAAATALAAVEALQAAEPGARKKILYITAGAPNCAADALNVEELLESLDPELDQVVWEARFGPAILTHVIGVGIAGGISPDLVDSQPDGVNLRKLLNTLAESGGAAKAGPEKFWAADDDTELLAALDASIRQGLSCVVQLAAEPQDPFAVVVRVDDKFVKPTSDCAGESGWHYKVEGIHDEIELCGEACALFQETGVLTAETYCLPQ